MKEDTKVLVTGGIVLSVSIAMFLGADKLGMFTGDLLLTAVTIAAFCGIVLLCYRLVERKADRQRKNRDNEL